MKQFVLIWVSLFLGLGTHYGLAEDSAPWFQPEGYPGCSHGKDEAKYRHYFSNLRTDHGFDATYYDVHLEIDPETEMVEGTVHMTATSTEAGLQTIELDLMEDMTVSNVVMNDTDVDFIHENNQLAITLDTAYDEGQPFTVSVQYYGTPAYGIYFFPSIGEVSTHNQPSDVRYYIPCFDDPSDKADSLSMNLTFPSEWNVYSNGVLREIVDNGETRTHRWHTQYPISTYLIAFVASPDYEVLELEYEALDGTIMPMPCYVFNWQYEEAEGSFQDMQFMMESLVNHFGEYPFLAEKYGQASFHIFGGGMENQTITLLHANTIDGSINHNFWLYAHELGHQWWGDMITCETWADIWLNEGFASYTEALYYEAYFGDIRPYVLSMRNSYQNQGYDHPVYDPPPGFLFSNVVYDKAGMVLHMLRGLYPDQFDDILAEYRAQYAFSTAETADFHQVCETVTGDDLDWFFDEWIYDEGYPQFDIFWDMWQSSENTYTLEMALYQTQTAEGDRLFEMPMQLGGDYTINEDNEIYELETVQIEATDANYVTLTFNDEPLDVAIDPYEWVVVKSVNVARTQKFAVDQIGILDNDNDQLLEENETANLVFGLRNGLAPAENVSVTLVTTDDAVTITDDTAVFGTIGAGEMVLNTNDPFTIQIADEIEPHEVSFDLVISWGDGSHTTIEQTVAIGPAQDVLVVNDDDGNPAYLHYYTGALEAAPTAYQIRDNRLFGVPTSEHLDNFDLVIWYTGDQTENTLTGAEQAVLMTYLENGGNLLLSGQGIAEDIGNSMFYTDYLHATMQPGNTSGQRILQGVDGDPISDGMVVSISGGDGANNQTHVNVIEPQEDAESFLNFFPTTNSVALHYQGDYRLIYLAFGFEAVNQRTPVMASREELMYNMLMFLDPNVDVVTPEPHILTPESYSLSNYPNPFNPQTTIAYELPQTTEVTLAIYDIQGRLIRTLVHGAHSAGRYSTVWNGRDSDGQPVGSGVYVYRLTTDTFSDSRTMMLMK